MWVCERNRDAIFAGEYCENTAAGIGSAFWCKDCLVDFCLVDFFSGALCLTCFCLGM